MEPLISAITTSGRGLILLLRNACCSGTPPVRRLWRSMRRRSIWSPVRSGTRRRVTRRLACQRICWMSWRTVSSSSGVILEKSLLASRSAAE